MNANLFGIDLENAIKEKWLNKRYYPTREK
jgi:hypothetical protein